MRMPHHVRLRSFVLAYARTHAYARVWLVTQPRVFNFGLLKTGTTSLHEALKALGIASCKWQPDFRYVTLNETAAFVRSPLHGSTRALTRPHDAVYSLRPHRLAVCMPTA